jgi:hypothetical protein
MRNRAPAGYASISKTPNRGLRFTQLLGGEMTERLFKASEYREAEAEHKRNNPTKGDYWWEDHFCPVLVVLAVAKDFVTVCRKTKDVGDNKWTWDLTKPEILNRADFVEKLEYGRVGGDHSWAAREFERGCVSSTEQFINLRRAD